MQARPLLRVFCPSQVRPVSRRETIDRSESSLTRTPWDRGYSLTRLFFGLPSTTDWSKRSGSLLLPTNSGTFFAAILAGARLPVGKTTREVGRIAGNLGKMHRE